MALNYNAILKVFIKYYPDLNKYDINGALLSIIDPSFGRLFDSDFAYEQEMAKRNVPSAIVKRISKDHTLTFDEALENAEEALSIFTNKKSNDKIRFIIGKIIEDDEELETTNRLIYNNQKFINLQGLPFTEYLISLVVYTVQYTKCHIKDPIEDEKLEQLNNLGINEAPHIFLETDNTYLKKYEIYYKKAVEDYKDVRTILYKQEPVYFYDIYISPDISTTVSFMRDKTYKELINNQTTTNAYLATFGKFTSITAPGGFGKSMFLLHLFLCDSIKGFPDTMKSNVVPILIKVRSFIKVEASLEQMLYQNISKYINIDFRNFIDDLKQGGFLMMFDGLDELKSSEAESFFDELNSLTDKYPNNSYITSSRPSEQAECLRKFKSLTLHGFRIDRAKRMISKLPGIEKSKKKAFCDILDRGEYKKNEQIASNPLLLTLMFMVYMNNGKLPAKTYQFYEKAYEVLYKEHDAIKGYKGRKFHTNLKKLELSMVLSEFCFLTTESQDYEFSETDIIKIIKKSSFASKVSPDDFIADLTDNLNLLYLENDTYHFVHRSFQEYFAANYCELMSDDEYSNLVKWFENLFINRKKNKKNPKYSFSTFFSLCGDGVFRLLNEMNRDRFLTLIIKPYLSKFIKEENTIDSYLHFLLKGYGNIEYGYEICMTPKENFLKLVVDQFTSDYYADISNYDCPEYHEYEKEGFWMTKPDNQYEPPEKLDEFDLNRILDDFETEAEREEWLEANNIDPNVPEFYDYSVPVKDIIDDKEKFEALLEIICDKRCELMKAYQRLRYILFN